MLLLDWAICLLTAFESIMVQVCAAKPLPTSNTKPPCPLNIYIGFLISQVILCSAVWSKFYQPFQFIRIIPKNAEEIHHFTMQIVYCLYVAPWFVKQYRKTSCVWLQIHRMLWHVIYYPICYSGFCPRIFQYLFHFPTGTGYPLCALVRLLSCFFIFPVLQYTCL